VERRKKSPLLAPVGGHREGPRRVYINGSKISRIPYWVLDFGTDSFCTTTGQQDAKKKNIFYKKHRLAFKEASDTSTL